MISNWPKVSLPLGCLCLAAVSAIAYNSGARDSLLRSRDQCADQRAKLERTYSDLDRRINELQQQKYNVYQYLADCDRTIRELDRALSAQDQAYNRGR